MRPVCSGQQCSRSIKQAAWRRTCKGCLVELLHQHWNQHRLADCLNRVPGCRRGASRAACCAVASRLGDRCAATGAWLRQQVGQAACQPLHDEDRMRDPAGKWLSASDLHSPTSSKPKCSHPRTTVALGGGPSVHAHLQLCVVGGLRRCGCPRVPHLCAGAPVAAAIPSARRPGCWPGPAAGNSS